MDDLTIRLASVSKSYQGSQQKKRLVLNDLHMTIRSGEITALMGHNGAGKTTTLKIILSLIRPDHGTVMIGAKPLAKFYRHSMGYMAEVQRLPQELTPWEILSVHGVLVMAHLARKEREAKQEEFLNHMQIFSSRHQPIQQLSKGQAQRLAWILAHWHKPRVLVLDEPFSGLDPLGEKELLTSIHAYQKTMQSTVILTTHSFATAKNLAQHLIILKEGTKVYDGPSVLEFSNPEVLFAQG